MGEGENASVQKLLDVDLDAIAAEGAVQGRRKAKTIFIILSTVAIAVIVFALVWQHTKYNKSFDEDFPEDISFGMSVEEVLDDFKVLSDFGFEVKCYPADDTRTIVECLGNIYRFDDDKLTSIYLNCSETTRRSIVEKYGKADKIKNGFYFWYGRIDGVKCYMSYEKDRKGIEFGIK